MQNRTKNNVNEQQWRLCVPRRTLWRYTNVVLLLLYYIMSLLYLICHVNLNLDVLCVRIQILLSNIPLMVEVDHPLTRFHISMHFWPPVRCSNNCTYFRHIWLAVGFTQIAQWQLHHDSGTMEVKSKFVNKIFLVQWCQTYAWICYQMFSFMIRDFVTKWPLSCFATCSICSTLQIHYC